MPLDVSPQPPADAELGEVREEDCVETVRTSLPYAYTLVASLVDELRGGVTELTGNHTPPPSEKERGQLPRTLSSDAVRGGPERHFGVGLAFMNRHRVAVFRPEAVRGETHRKFTSLRSQILNRSPEFRDR
ncbi:SCO5389 family protein [Streptomyces sp. NPDC051217]|uniref:SCO5389 family protein n=1 Tax=Streptomyces sp. NPDC051217 TaxID=3365644 RepID=UPI0037A49E47